MGDTLFADDDAPVRPPDETTSRDPSVHDRAISIRIESGDVIRVVKIAGELDLANQRLVTHQCTEGRTRAVVADISELTFLDCGGYRAFIAARAALEQDHRTLTVVGAVGEPRRLLDLIRHMKLRGPAC
jgi:anti-anti-sigma factor